MASGKKGILVYADYLPIFENLEDDEAGRLIKHFFRYVNDKNPEAPDRITAIAFEPIKQQLKRDLINYLATCEKNSENAKKRWNKDNATASDGIKKDTIELNGKQKFNATALNGIKRDAKHADNDTDTDNNATKVTSTTQNPEVIGKEDDLPF